MRAWTAGLFAAAVLAAAGHAWGDFVPTHGTLGPHLDPFSWGWPVPKPAAGPGKVVTYNEFDMVGPYTADFLFGFDNANSAGGWIWETEIDLDPVNPQGGSVPITFWAFGKKIGTFTVPLVNGPDIYLDIHQMDMPEIGGFFKGLINLTPGDVAWGTSVKEDPDVQLDPDTVVKWLYKGSDQENELLYDFTETLPPDTNFNSWVLTGNLTDGINVYQADIPEPASLLVWVLLAIGGARIVSKRARISSCQTTVRDS